MSEQSLHIIEVIEGRLKRTAKRRYLTHFVFGLVLVLGIFSGLWLLFTAIEAGFWMPATARTIAFGFIVGLSAVLMIWFVLFPLLRMTGVIPGPSQDALARDIGNTYPQIADRLLNLLQLARGRSSASSNTFVDHAVSSLNRHIAPVEFEKMDGFDRALRASKVAVLPALGIVVFLLAAPSLFIDASQRLLAPSTEFMRPLPFQLHVTPGSVELLRGDSLQVRVHLEGAELPESLTLRVRNEGEDRIVEEQLTPRSYGVFARTFVNVRRSFSYTIAVEGARTSWYDVDIVERPIIRSLQVGLEFPRYSRIPPQRLEPNVGDVQALPGTRVNVEATIGGPDIIQAFVEYDNGQKDTLEIDGNQARGAFTLNREGTYHVLLIDAKENRNGNPIKYSMKLLEDALPTAVLLSPAPLTELSDALETSLRARITDDFGFSRLSLFYRLSESRFGETSPDFEEISLPLPSRTELDQDILHNWVLTRDTDLDPVPGDAIEYFIRVWDNDAYAGYKPSTSATQLLRLPSLAEQYKELDEKEEAAEDNIEEILRDTESIEEQFQELQDELRNKLESDWEDQRQLERIREKQTELESRVDDLNQSFEQMREQMEDNNLVSDETLQLYEEMQQVLEEINSPELMEALNELQKAMQELNLQQMQESLNNFQVNEEQYQQRLERALELFKQLRVQKDLEEVARRAEALAQEQEQLREQTEALEEEPEESPADDNEPDDRGQEAESEESDPEADRPREGNTPEPDESQHPTDQESADESNRESSEAEQDSEPPSADESDSEKDSENDRDSRQDDTPPNEALAQKQELSKEEMEALEEKLEEILERMQEVEHAPSQEMEQLNEEVKDQQIPDKMEQNAEQLRQNQLNEAQQQQQQMQQQLQQMQQQLQQMQEGMQGAQMQINLAGLRRALSDILTLSQLQEELREDVRELATESPTMRGLAQEQVELSSGLRVVSDSLQSLAKKIPQMSREVQQHAGDAMREMSSAVGSITERVANRATGHQKESMMHLNELALLLSDLLNEMMNMQGSGGGGGTSMQQMIEQLQNAAGQQQKLNQQIQNMLNETQGNRLSQDMQERLRQLSAQQEQIRSQIKSMSRNRELRGKIMGDLNRIAEQMQEAVRELQQGRPGRQTLERQQQILTRLLDATKSMQERGREKRREGQIGEDFYRESPEGLTPSEEADKLRRALIEALESGYSPDYEELIKRYFELLQERSLEVEP